MGESKLKHEETVVNGLEHARRALNQMFEGSNTGKLLVKVAEPGTELPPGAFGENLSVGGLLEDRVCIGDTFALGGATVQVNQPRGPCYKIAARWGYKTLPDLMAKAGISGFYLRVLEEGRVRAGDEMTLTDRRSDVTVAEVMRVTYRDRRDREGLARVIAVPELAAGWRVSLERLLGGLPLRH
jgi:MOSC domain-containing protein YiiM